MSTVLLPWWGWLLVGVLLYLVFAPLFGRLVGHYLWWRAEHGRAWRRR